MLPAAVDRGKDVGLINMAYNLPLVVAPLAAGVVLGLMNSYPALFALAGRGDGHGRVDSQPRPFGTLIAFTKSI